MSATVVASPYVHQPYPKMLYKAGQTPITVKDQAAHLALEPGWGEVPTGAVTAPAAAPVAAPPPLAPSASAVELELATLRAENARLKGGSQPVAPKPLIFAPGADGVSAEQQIQADIDADAAAERTALWATPEAAIITRLKGSSKATLLKVQSYEAQNPDGARKKLMAALAKAIKAGK
jgi:hypothetical protein